MLENRSQRSSSMMRGCTAPPPPPASPISWAQMTINVTVTLKPSFQTRQCSCKTTTHTHTRLSFLWANDNTFRNVHQAKYPTEDGCAFIVFIMYVHALYLSRSVFHTLTKNKAYLHYFIIYTHTHTHRIYGATLKHCLANGTWKLLAKRLWADGKMKRYIFVINGGSNTTTN